MKYVIARNSLTGHWLPVVFDESLIHRYIAVVLKQADKHNMIVSAGFCHLKEGKWQVGAEISDSLKIGPSIHDSTIINLCLMQGLSGLDLSNMLAFLALTYGGVPHA